MRIGRITDARFDNTCSIGVAIGHHACPSPLFSEHATEGEALDAAVKVAAGIVGWSVDVLPPAICDA